MQTQNPYSPPSSAATQEESYGNPLFARFSKEAVEKLYFRSCNVTAVASFTSFISIILLTNATLALASSTRVVGFDFYIILFGFLGGFGAISAYHMIRRSRSGRNMGIGWSFFALILFPVGTIIGIAGLFGFIQAPILFGEKRITHKELKKEYKFRRSLRI
ncbi:hypothetical protein Rhal01_03495 [Rubritalea halochordaticola]|uniref:DUF805 domain-containing protein n=2 Tax=Rubritalea halochordaticola TaxID=714537 RepID=A0ABP9V9K0_9BACT